jgi:hypothetical protein
MYDAKAMTGYAGQSAYMPAEENIPMRRASVSGRVG